MNRKKVVTIVTGAGTLATGLASNLFTVPASAATAPSCDASASPSSVASKVASANAGLTAKYNATAAAKALKAATAQKQTAYGKAKGAAKTAALKALNAAKAKEAAALAAYKKLNTYSIFTSSPTQGTAIADTSMTPTTHTGLWQWGLYTTQVVIKGGALVDVCTSIDESNAGNDTGTKATEDDRRSSANFQGIAQTWDSPIPGYLPVVWHAAMYAPAKSATKISDNVQKCVKMDYNTMTAPCLKGGLADPTKIDPSDPSGKSLLTGATYTVETFKLSLANALNKAVTAKAIAN